MRLSQSTNPSSGPAARASDEESYSYRIGMIHKCRDVAYANAGVRSGALSTGLEILYLTSLGLHLICERASALSAPSGCVAEIAFRNSIVCLVHELQLRSH